jgi:hypothetical protein
LVYFPLCWFIVPRKIWQPWSQVWLSTKNGIMQHVTRGLCLTNSKWDAVWWELETVTIHECHHICGMNLLQRQRVRHCKRHLIQQRIRFWQKYLNVANLNRSYLELSVPFETLENVHLNNSSSTTRVITIFDYVCNHPIFITKTTSWRCKTKRIKCTGVNFILTFCKLKRATNISLSIVLRTSSS